MERQTLGHFLFRLFGEGWLDGRSSFILEAMPHKGHQPRSSTAKLFRSLKGRFWVNQQDRPIVKVEAEAIDTIRQALAHLELSGISIVLQFGRNTGT
jgi:hypothetical protein